MIYSHRELTEWWTHKSKTDQRRLLDLVIENDSTWDSFREYVRRMKKDWEKGLAPNPQQLQKLRSWDKE